MTGFGRGTVERDQTKIICEIKALNGKYFDAEIRLPKYLAELDPLVRKFLSDKLTRGTLTVSYHIKVESENGLNQEIRINLPLAKQYLEAIRNLEFDLGTVLNDKIYQIVYNDNKSFYLLDSEKKYVSTEFLSSAYNQTDDIGNGIIENICNSIPII